MAFDSKYHRKPKPSKGQYVKAYQEGGPVNPISGSGDGRFSDDEERTAVQRSTRNMGRSTERANSAISGAQPVKDWMYEPGRGEYEQEENANPTLAGRNILRRRSETKDNGDPSSNSYHSFRGKGPTKARAK